MRKPAQHPQRDLTRSLVARLLATAMLAAALPAGLFGQLLDQAQTPLTTHIAHRLQISSGDLLEVGVFDTPELSGKLRVNEAGEIVVPVAGTLQVAGMTSDEAA